jgi:hypothetical protein
MPLIQVLTFSRILLPCLSRYPDARWSVAGDWTQNGLAWKLVDYVACLLASMWLDALLPAG